MICITFHQFKRFLVETLHSHSLDVRGLVWSLILFKRSIFSYIEQTRLRTIFPFEGSWDGKRKARVENLKISGSTHLCLAHCKLLFDALKPLLERLQSAPVEVKNSHHSTVTTLTQFLGSSKSAVCLIDNLNFPEIINILCQGLRLHHSNPTSAGYH